MNLTTLNMQVLHLLDLQVLHLLNLHLLLSCWLCTCCSPILTPSRFPYDRVGGRWWWRCPWRTRPGGTWKLPGRQISVFRSSLCPVLISTGSGIASLPWHRFIFLSKGGGEGLWCHVWFVCLFIFHLVTCFYGFLVFPSSGGYFTVRGVFGSLHSGPQDPPASTYKLLSTGCLFVLPRSFL